MSRQADPKRIADKREQIAVEAAKLFATFGYERTSVAHVAEKAGISPASVFYYFEDKAALFRSVFERDLPAAEALITHHQDAPDPVVAILGVLDNLAQDAASPTASGMLIELLRRIGDDPELLSVVERTTSVVRDGLSALIARGISDGLIDSELDTTETAAWLQSIVDATYLNARPGHSPQNELHRTVLGFLNPPQPRMERSDG